MKNILKFIIPIFLIIIITLICCIIFIKPNLLKFQETEEFRYVENNKDNIDKFIVKTVTLLGKNCYEIDSNKGYNILNDISLKKEVNVKTFDSDMYLEVYFNNDIKKSFYFEGENFVYNNKKYKLKNDIILINKDEYESDKITEDMVIVSNENKIECK